MALLLVSGCTGSDPGQVGGPQVSSSPAAVAGPVLSALEPAEGAEVDYPTAELVGRLTLRDGCLALGGSPTLWPAGTRWDSSSRSVVLADGARVEVGTLVRAGGGYVPASVASSYAPATQDEVDVCMRVLGADSLALVGGVR